MKKYLNCTKSEKTLPTPTTYSIHQNELWNLIKIQQKKIQLLMMENTLS